MTAAPATLLRPAAPAGDARPFRAAAARGPITVRPATPSDAAAIEALVTSQAASARLLPRHAAEIAAHAARFVVAVQDAAIVACADLAPLGDGTAEIRSLVVAPDARAGGLGHRLLEALATRARADGHTRLCAFTHAPAWFVRRGFSVVPHAWVPGKAEADCHGCDAVGRCGQQAVVRALDREAPRTGELQS